VERYQNPLNRLLSLLEEHERDSWFQNDGATERRLLYYNSSLSALLRMALGHRDLQTSFCGGSQAKSSLG
jgi:hypothetical protein